MRTLNPTHSPTASKTTSIDMTATARPLNLRLAIAACLSAAAAAAMWPAGVVHAQEAAASQEQGAADAADATELDAIVVTGSRIARDGYDAPTPVSVLGVEEIQAAAVASITEFVTQLPSVLGSQTAATNAGSLSNGQAGIAALNLRSLGSNRTLVLLDGQRSVTSAATGLVDVNTFPQALIQRVEIVTGGASAAYGSDAVGGVVNMILDRKYTGMKSNYEYGVTSYDDAPNQTFTLTAGAPFAGGRGHILFNSEYFTQASVDTIDRPWNKSGFFQIDNPAYTATNGQPLRLVSAGIGPSQMTPGGVITAGPLRGTYFSTINPATGTASTGQLVFGQSLGQWMVGGDWQYTSSNHTSSNSLIGDEDRRGLFSRVSFDVTDNVNVFAQASYNTFEGQSYYQQTPNGQGANVTIRTDNAFVPASVRTALGAATSFTLGTSNAGIPAAGSNNTRTVTRYVLGAEGSFSLMEKDWKWDTYYQRGTAKTDEMLINTWNNANMAAATDAIVNSSGQVVCRNPNLVTAGLQASPGCVPINRLGIGGITPEALAYIFPSNPLRNQELTQDAAALTFSSTNLFDVPAGPVSLALGAEWRKEAIDGTVDKYYEAGWLYGNYKVTKGDYTAKEAFFETVVPIWKTLEFNGAFRATDYSVSGSVETWKAGLTFAPLDDVKFRITKSRDIRAPNLSELFASGTARTNTVNVPDGVGGATRSNQFTENTTGNLGLTPEVADSIGFGVVLSPRFAPGLTFSVDYFDIDIEDAVGTINAQNTVNLCYEQGKQDLCNNLIFASGGVTVPGSVISQINIKPINFASQTNKGIDLEASYRTPVGPGNLTVRGLATHYINNITNNGVDFPTENAGTTTTPSWNYRLSTSYNIEPVTLTLTGRGFSSSVYDPSYIECTTNCPTSTAKNRTINENDIAGSFYLDFSANYSFMVGPAQAEAFFAVKNLANRDPVLVGNGPTGNNTDAYPQTVRTLYDVFGRTFRLGVRMSFQ
ncbi:MAG: TonB-dependent receptor [Steroidobacteraceae bacterium]